MKNTKKEFLQILSQIQRKQLLSFLKSFITKQEILDKNNIFEDSDVGIEAAEKSGASVFVVRGFA
jgi:hypothetical protein